MDKLTAPEEQAMQAIWVLEQANIKAILEKLEPPIPPYTTLASTIKNLEKKGFLASRLVGNTYIYRPVITEEAYKTGFMGNFIKDYFDNSYKAMVNFFVEQKQLSKSELEDILGMIEDNSKKESI